MHSELTSYVHQLVWKVSEKCFDGELPNDADQIIGILAATLFKDTEPELLQHILPELHDAVRKHLAMQYFQFPL